MDQADLAANVVDQADPNRLAPVRNGADPMKHDVARARSSAGRAGAPGKAVPAVVRVVQAPGLEWVAWVPNSIRSSG